MTANAQKHGFKTIKTLEQQLNRIKETNGNNAAKNDLGIDLKIFKVGDIVYIDELEKFGVIIGASIKKRMYKINFDNQTNLNFKELRKTIKWQKYKSISLTGILL